MATVTGVKVRPTPISSRPRTTSLQSCSSVLQAVSGAPVGILQQQQCVGISNTTPVSTSSGRNFSWS